MKKSLLIVISIVALSVFGCETPHESNEFGNNSTFSGFPNLTGSYFGSFHLYSDSTSYTLSHIKDSIIAEKIGNGIIEFDREFCHFSFTNNASVNDVALNSVPCDIIGGNGKYNYTLDSAIFHKDGTNNVFQWSEGGVLRSYSVAYNAPRISITSPTMKQTVNKNGDLTITWTPSSNTEDFVQIRLVGVDTTSFGGSGYTTTASFFEEYGYDTGSFTIPASKLSQFYEAKANLSLSRGIVRETTINSKDYFFLLVTNRRIEIELQ